MMSPDPTSLKSLVAEYDGFVRALARRFVSDPDTVEDIAQDVWIIALLKRPVPGPGVRAWLSSVARNVALKQTHKDRLRSRHEARYAQTKCRRRSTGVDPLLCQALNEIVDLLPSATREAILARYYSQRPLASVARSHGVPAATIRSRSSRGVREIREQLRPRMHRLGLDVSRIAAEHHPSP